MDTDLKNAIKSINYKIDVILKHLNIDMTTVLCIKCSEQTNQTYKCHKCLNVYCESCRSISDNFSNCNVEQCETCWKMVCSECYYTVTYHGHPRCC